MNLLYRSLRGPGWLLLLLLAAFVLAACATEASPKGIDQQDQAAIYSTIIRQIYVEDDTFGGALQPSTLYIIRYTDDKAGDHTAPSSEPIALPEATQSEITASLRDLPTEIVWVDALEDVNLDPDSHRVANNGAVITLGNIVLQEDGSVQAPGSIYVASLAAGGQTYVLEEINGAWQITGTAGPQWMS